MIDEQWLRREKIECTKQSNNSLWWGLVSDVFNEYLAARRQAEDALRLDRQSRNRVALLEEKLVRLGQA